MIILPAIDLKDGQCVRLRQGRADDVTIYSDDPVAQAMKWREQGAEELHVVDLDGAFNGQPMHTLVIREIIRKTGMKVEVGGGIRDDRAIEHLVEAGVTRAIIGTRALENPAQLKRWIGLYGETVAVGIDARGGMVQVRGWVESSDTRATDLAKRVADWGVKTIIYTDIETDGMLGGTNLAEMAAMCDAVPGVNIIASGGVSDPAHIRALAELARPNLHGAIVGKALYDGRTTLHAMIEEAVHAGKR